MIDCFSDLNPNVSQPNLLRKCNQKSNKEIKDDCCQKKKKAGKNSCERTPIQAKRYLKKINKIYYSCSHPQVLSLGRNESTTFLQNR